MTEDDTDKNKGVHPFRKKTRFQMTATESVLVPENSKKGSVMDDTLGKRLITAVKEMDTEQVRDLLGQDAPVNYIESNTGATAVHHAVGRGDWETLDVLLETGKCNLLIRDKWGRLPSRLAAEFRGDMKQAERLMDLEKEQGKKIGINPAISGDKPIPGFE